MRAALGAGAGAVAVLHGGLVAFLLAGGTLARLRPAVRSWHLPVVGGVLLVNVLQWDCPLTLLENRLRVLAGSGEYQGGFLEHYLIRHLSADGMTAQVQLLIYAVAISSVVAPYALPTRRGARRAPTVAPEAP